MADLMYLFFGKIQTENSVEGLWFCAYLHNIMEFWENNILQGKSSVIYYIDNANKMKICSCCLLKNRKNGCYLVTDLVICSNMTILHAPQAARYQLVSLGTASKNPLEVTAGA